MAGDDGGRVQSGERLEAVKPARAVRKLHHAKDAPHIDDVPSKDYAAVWQPDKAIAGRVGSAGVAHLNLPFTEGQSVCVVKGDVGIGGRSAR